MPHALCNLSMIPLRADPSDRAEMSSQVLFGELLTVNQQQGTWLNVTCFYDGFSGWIDHKQCKLIPDELADSLMAAPSSLCYDMVQIAFNETGQFALPVCIGCTLPGLDDRTFFLDRERFLFDGHAVKRSTCNREMICDTAMLYLNSPYLWGGRSPFGIDCSGLVQMVFLLNGIRLRRNAAMQSELGIQVGFAGQAEPGDIAFFENSDGVIIHTGIIFPGQKIIHASGRVRIDAFDHEGIYNQEIGKYTHKLRLIRSVLNSH